MTIKYNYEGLKNLYKDKGLQYRPEERRHAIAYKKIDNYFKPGYKKENKLIDDIMDLRLLEDSIERAFSEFLTKQRNQDIK